MTRHENQVLREAGVPGACVARQAEVSERSVWRIAKAAPAGADGAAPPAGTTRSVGRPSTATPWAPVITRWLAEKRPLPSMGILRRVQEQGYAGGKSAVYELIRRLRPVEATLLVRFEGVPGEFSQHDFGQVDVHYRAGGGERIHFFARRLKWSRFVHVTLVRGLLAAFDAFNGVPLVTVWDNPKTIVISRKGGRIVWNPVFGQVALDYRFAPELCWPRSGQQKGAVENLVGWVEGSFFKCRRCHDRADLKAQLAQWLIERNTRRQSRATGVIPSVRLAQEHPRLRPLPIAPAAYALTIPVVVSARARGCTTAGVTPCRRRRSASRPRSISTATTSRSSPRPGCGCGTRAVRAGPRASCPSTARRSSAPSWSPKATA